MERRRPTRSAQLDRASLLGGLDELEAATFVALLGSNTLKLAVLHDRGSSPHRAQARARLLDAIDPQPFEANIKDLVPRDAYIGE